MEQQKSGRSRVAADCRLPSVQVHCLLHFWRDNKERRVSGKGCLSNSDLPKDNFNVSSNLGFWGAEIEAAAHEADKASELAQYRHKKSTFDTMRMRYYGEIGCEIGYLRETEGNTSNKKIPQSL